MAGEMIENAIRCGKIEGEAAKRSAPRRKDNKVNNTSSFNSKAFTVGQPKVAADGQQGSQRQESGVNVIGKASERMMKENVAEVRMPMKVIWEEMMKREMITSGKEREKMGNYCEFHGEEGHEAQNCEEFKALVQGFIDNKELQNFEPAKDHISLPGNNEVGTPAVPKVIIHKPTPFPYKDSKKVPWNYDCSVTRPEEENIASASKDVQAEGSHARSGKRYDTGASEWSPQKQKVSRWRRRAKYPSMSHVVEQLRKQPACILVLALLLSSEAHREALMKVLNETYVTHDISVNKLDRLVNNISADNFIYFNDDKIPPGGRGSTKALHITTRCKGYTLPSVLVDNGSALNVLPLSTLNRLPIDDSHMKTCQNMVRAFNGTERKVMGRIDIPLEIGPNMYEIYFLVMDIKPSYNCLLDRPWIHSTGAVPSSLYQKLKLVIDGRLITINAEEDIIVAVTSKAPYVETNEESIECSFRSLEFVNVTFISEGSELLVPMIATATRMALQMMAGKGALPGKCLGKYLQ
ncbi:uncharacterized protein [Gossypium hirsutum]|uniref:Uncharacterized protein n=1 Tax=Gossypium hirsutum TaxID=3635 RepID=A0A1U8HMM7_GOSHI|nr:uncharacterized protein LOC107887553 [Gossypium hirsutum]